MKEPTGSVVLALHVQPRASRSEVVGMVDGVLRVRLAAPPVDGAANAALIELLAERLGLPKRQLRLVAGDGSRRKQVAITGADDLAVVIERLTTPPRRR